MWDFVLGLVGGVLLAITVIIAKLVRPGRRATNIKDDGAAPTAVLNPDKVREEEPVDSQVQENDRKGGLDDKRKLYFASAGQSRALLLDVLYDTVHPSRDTSMEQNWTVFRLDFFRDLENKHLPDTNAQCARRLPTGCFLLVSAVQLEFWTVDDEPFDGDSAWVRIQMNKQRVVEVPLRCFKNNKCLELEWQYSDQPETQLHFNLDESILIVSEHDLEVQVFMQPDTVLPAAVRLTLVGKGGTTYPPTVFLNAGCMP